MQRHLHLPPAGEHVDGAVLVLAHDHAVGRRWLGELVDFLTQRGDVITSLPQRVGELLVAGDRLRELALGLEQALLERAHPLRGLGQPRPEVLDLGDERLDLFLWFLGHGSSSLFSEPLRRPCERTYTHVPASARHVPAVTRHHIIRDGRPRRFSAFGARRRGAVEDLSRGRRRFVPE
jgi:hypothetical protein